jgi:NTE family protein
VETPTDLARMVRALTGRAVGLVLSGGGARGFAHIGVARALRQSGIPIDLLGGTSMGAVVAASLASGWDDYEVVARNRRCFVDTNPLADLTVPVVSLFKGAKVSALLRSEFGETTMIEDLPQPFFCVTANLTRGRSDVRDRGLLARWLRASVAIPGVIRPVFDQGEVNVDGGVINNLPVDVMRGLGRGPVIGVDVSTDDTFTAASDAEAEIPLWQRVLGRRRQGVPNIMQILWRAGTVNSGAKLRAVSEQTDLLIQPPLESIDMLDWKAFDRAIEAGYAHTMRLLERTPLPLPEAES